MSLEVVPVVVGELSRGWDQQHLDLEAAAAQVADADVSGFTPEVGAVAARFVAAWARLVGALGATCEVQADGLRTTIATVLASDEESAGASVLLAGSLEEQR